MSVELPTMAHLVGTDPDVPGDCWRCCVAGMLGLARDEVPHFLADHPEGDEWFTATKAWVESRVPGGTIDAFDPVFPAFISEPPYPLVIMSGPSPRGPWSHAVLVDWRTGDLVWDPHPDRTGLAGPPFDMVCVIAREAS